MPALKSDYVCGVWDITGTPLAGKSSEHSVYNPAVVTTNGAGPRNVQIGVFTSDGHVLMVLPGTWNPQDLMWELGVCKELNTVWEDPALTRAQKETKFHDIQLAAITKIPADMARRSRLQGFDMKWSVDHHVTDVFKPGMPQDDPKNKAAFKNAAELMHERMASRPFQTVAQFDLMSFCNYGRPKYDKKDDEGIPDPKPQRMRRRRGG